MRRGVMGYYDLAKEARSTLSSLKKSSAESEEEEREVTLWEERLTDLSIRVASALVEMEDFDGASRFLSTLTPAKGLYLQKALLYLCLGQVDAARACVSSPDNDNGDSGKEVILALALMADAEYEEAVDAWEELIATQGEGSEAGMYRQNLAVALLYLGRMSEVNSLLTLHTFVFITSNNELISNL